MADMTYIPDKTLSSTANWMRQYRIKVYTHTAPPSASTKTETYNQEFATEKDTDLVLDVSDLRCVFNVRRVALYYPNQALVTIYNLNASTEKSIIEEGYRIIIEAGYPSNYGQIFDGTVLMCTRTKQDGTDYILNILAIDGSQFVNEGYCTYTYARGQTLRDVAQGIANKASNPIQLKYASPMLDTIKLSKGIAGHGSVKTTFSDIARTINGTWYVDNGQLYIVAYSDSKDILPMGKKAVKLTPQTGLLGTPQQVGYGVKARSLLNPQIVPYGLVNIPSQYILEQMVQIGSYSEGVTRQQLLDKEDLYRVCSVTFTGDTRGNEWYSDVVTVTQSGEIMAVLGDSSYTGN